MLNPYEFKGKGHFQKDLFHRYIYRFKFKSKSKNITRIYLVYADRYDHDIYIVKFFDKNDSLAEDKKYRVLKGDFVAKRIMDTCVEIGRSILSENPLASFGFIGAASFDEHRKNTKRFRVYSLYAANYFSEAKTAHFTNDSYSAYFLMNTANSEVSIDKARTLFEENYDFGEWHGDDIQEET